MMSSFPKKKHEIKTRGNSLISLSTARESASLRFTGNLIKWHGKYAPSRALCILNLTTLIQSQHSAFWLINSAVAKWNFFSLPWIHTHSYTISLAKLKIIIYLLLAFLCVTLEFLGTNPFIFIWRHVYYKIVQKLILKKAWFIWKNKEIKYSMLRLQSV